MPSKRSVNVNIDGVSANAQVGSLIVPGKTYFAQVTVEGQLLFPKPQVMNLRGPDGAVSRWTLILGDNGSGKTTLLRALAACSVGSGSNTPGPLPRISSALLSRSFSRKAEMRECKAGMHGDIVWPFCVGYGAGRRAAPSTRSGSVPPLASLMEDADLPDPEEWFLRTDHLSRVSKGESQLLHTVGGILKKLLPDVTGLAVRPDPARRTPRVDVKIFGSWCPLANLSFGYRTALCWIVDLARRLFDRYPDAPDPLSEPVVVLIDEIDLHLHPRWQRDLLARLHRTFPSAQFIATAHSPLVVQAAPEANLVLTRRQGSSIIIENDLDYVRNWRIDQILASDLFGSQPVHAPAVQHLLDERRKLLRKSTLSAAARKRVADIDGRLREFPTASNPEDQEAMQLIREAAKLISSQQP